MFFSFQVCGWSSWQCTTACWWCFVFGFERLYSFERPLGLLPAPPPPDSSLSILFVCFLVSSDPFVAATDCVSWFVRFDRPLMRIPGEPSLYGTAIIFSMDYRLGLPTSWGLFFACARGWLLCPIKTLFLSDQVEWFLRASRTSGPFLGIGGLDPGLPPATLVMNAELRCCDDHTNIIFQRFHSSTDVPGNRPFILCSGGGLQTLYIGGTFCGVVDRSILLPAHRFIGVPCFHCLAWRFYLPMFFRVAWACFVRPRFSFLGGKSPIGKRTRHLRSSVEIVKERDLFWGFDLMNWAVIEVFESFR